MNFELQSALRGIFRSNDNVCKLKSKPTGFLLIGSGCATCCGDKILLQKQKIGRFYTWDTLSVWTDLGKHLEFVWLCASSMKTDTRPIMLSRRPFVAAVYRRNGLLHTIADKYFLNCDVLLQLIA